MKFSGECYESFKKKWTGRLKKLNIDFSSDIFNDTIIHIYDYLNKNIDNHIDQTNVEAFWYKSFLINSKREKIYAYNKKDDSIDVIELLSEIPDENPILLDDIKEGIKVLNDVEKNLILIYFLTDISIKELEELTNIKDLRYRIKKILSKIKKNM